MKHYFIILALFLFVACKPSSSSSDNQWLSLVVGSYTDSGATGIMSYRFNQSSGEFMLLDSATTSNPSYLAFSDDGNYIYAVNENGKDDSSISSFKFDSIGGGITFMNSVAIGSSAPCYISIVGDRAISANYFGGDLSIVGIDRSTGALTEFVSNQSFSNEESAKQSHLHTIYSIPNSDQLIATDLGKDRFYIYDSEDIVSSQKDQEIAYSSYPLAEGTGPRHVTTSSDGKYLYILGELSGEITIVERTGSDYKIVSTIVADSLNASGSADIHISGDGRDLYVTNRLKGDGIVHFAVKDGGAILERRGYYPTGEYPRNFVISPNGRFVLVASRDRNRVELFKRDIETGALTNTLQYLYIKKPVCLKFKM